MEQLDIRVDTRYRLLRKLGKGTYGAVYKAIDTKSGNHVAIKLEDINVEPSFLEAETNTYELLNGPGIPRVHWHGVDCEFRVMVIDLLGPNLEDLFNYCNREFSLKTVLMLADQLLCRLELMHSREILHRDIKPENILMGIGLNGNKVYITDFGLSTGDEAAVAERPLSFVGTRRFASINGHLGERQSPRDDLISLGYVLIYLLNGSLPWQGLRAESEGTKDTMVMEMKQAISNEQLCKGLPVEFQTYFDTLETSGVSQYRKHRKLFRKLFLRHKFEYDNVFDWTVLKYLEQKERLHK